MTSLSLDIAHSLPEIVLAIGALSLLMLGAFGAGKRDWIITEAAIVVLGIAFLSMFYPIADKALVWDQAFIDDNFARFMKTLVLLGSMTTLILSREYMARHDIDLFEFPVLVLLATLGMCMLVSAQSLIALYLGLELMSLALYVIAAFHRDDARGASRRDLVQPVAAVDDPNALGTQIAQHFGHWLQKLGRKHADQLALDGGGVGERPQNVEDRARAKLYAHGCNMARGGMVRGRHHEAKAGLAQAFFDKRRLQADSHA